MLGSLCGGVGESCVPFVPCNRRGIVERLAGWDLEFLGLALLKDQLFLLNNHQLICDLDCFQIAFQAFSSIPALFKFSTHSFCAFEIERISNYHNQMRLCYRAINVAQQVKAACCQAFHPEFYPQFPRGGRRESSPTSCPLSSWCTCILCLSCREQERHKHTETDKREGSVCVRRCLPLQ